MGNVKKLVLTFLSVLFLFCLPVVVTATNLDERIDEVRVEQVQVRMPQVKVYYYSKQKEDAKVFAADFASSPMEIKSQRTVNEEDSIHYYILLDVSASISKEYFNEIKDAIVSHQKDMNENDKLTFISFGDEVKIIAEEVTKNDSVKPLIKDLENRDMNTLLFQAIDKSAALIEHEPDSSVRNIMMIITDGEDFAENKATKNEAIKTLRERQIPLYAMAVKRTKNNKDNPYIDDFGEFARQTGGYLSVFETDTAVKTINKIRKELNKATVLTLVAQNNHISQTAKPLTIKFKNGTKAVTEVIADKNVADEERPTVKAYPVEANKFKVKFSEAVIGADKKENFMVKDEQGEPWAVKTVTYDADALATIVSLENDFENQTYSISFQNITDISMEANALEDVLPIVVTNAPEKVVEPAPTFLEKYWVALICVATILVVIILLMIAYILVKKRKGIVVVDGEAHFNSNIDMKHHIAVKEQKGTTIVLELKDARKQIHKVPVAVNGSVIIGRSKISDVYFDDSYLSKQHFVISKEGGNYYIEDLDTENGTMINGIRIMMRRQLSNGDRINAGRLEMNIKW